MTASEGSEPKANKGFDPVMMLDDLWPGEMKACIVSLKKILLVNHNGHVAAFEDKCPHKNVPMSQGFFKDGVLICAGHLWEFDATTGEGINPKEKRLKRLPTKIEDGRIFVSTNE